jgi:signal peptidase I
LGTRTGFSDRRAVTASADRPKGVLRDYTETILICVIFIVFARGFVIQQSEIPTESMEDTVLIGDYVLVNRLLYAPTSTKLERLLLPVRDIQRGDIVVFKHPGQPEKDYIKRVIGLPGDRVEVHGDTAWVNGRKLDEPYVNGLYRRPGFEGPWRVPPGHYFVMGDHRNRSADSRAPETQTVPRELIKGRAFMILFSTSAPPPGDDPGKVTFRSMPRRIWNLIFHGRWDRALRLIE